MTDASEPPAIAAFVAARGRLPRVGDETPPWRYAGGWMLPYLIGGHEVVPEMGDRWGYWMRTLEAGALLPEPIPRIAFGASAGRRGGASAPAKNIETCLSIVEADGDGSWSSLRSFVEWLGWGLGTAKMEPQLGDRTNEKLYRAFDLEPYLRAPGDHLGEFLAARQAKGWNPNAFFPTPHEICEAVAAMTFGDRPAILPDGRDARLATVCDPAVGTGRMLLHASNYSLLLFGQDVDSLVCAICRVNGALYAPWLAFPMPDAMLARSNAARPGAGAPRQLDLFDLALATAP